MNPNNFTQKSLEVLQSAQNKALENRNSYITPEHLFHALVSQDGGLIPSLFSKMGVDLNALASELESAIAALPKLGTVAEVYLSPEASQVFAAAEKCAKSLGDQYLSVEHIMLGLFAAGGPGIKRILSDHGITKNAFNTELPCTGCAA